MSWICDKLRLQISPLSNIPNRNKDDVSIDSLKRGNLVVFAGPREKFTEQELAAIKEYLAGGGSVLFMLAGGGEQRFNTNINSLMEEWGISFNNDSVVRTVFYKYFHPKVCGCMVFSTG